MIKPPIIANNFGDVLFFRSKRDAEVYIESIDVRNNEYVIYDSEGRLLQVTVNSNNTVVIQTAEEEPTHASQLRELLQKHLLALGVPSEWVAKALLPEIIVKRLEFQTD